MHDGPIRPIGLGCEPRREISHLLKDSPKFPRSSPLLSISVLNGRFCGHHPDDYQTGNLSSRSEQGIH